MKLLPDDPRARRDLRIGALVALMILLAAAILDLPYLATAVLPGLWVVLRSGAPRCAQAPVRPTTPH